MQEHGAMQEDGDEAPSASGSPCTSGRPDGGAGPRSARYGSTWPSPRRVERGRSTERRSLPGCTCPAATVDASASGWRGPAGSCGETGDGKEGGAACRAQTAEPSSWSLLQTLSRPSSENSQESLKCQRGERAACWGTDSRARLLEPPSNPLKTLLRKLSRISQEPRGGGGLLVGAPTAEPASWSLLQTLSRPS